MESQTLAPAQHRIEKKGRLERRLRLAAIFLFILIIVSGTFLLVKFFQSRNAPPRTYFQYQLQIWQAMLEKNPKDPAVNTNIGYIYLKMGENRRALDYLEKALSLNPKFVPALYNLGIYYKKQGQSGKAVKLLESAAENAEQGNKYLAYFTLGEIHQDGKKYDKALDYYTKSLDDNATIWNTYRRLGEIYEFKKDKKQAYENYKRASMFNPDDLTLKAKVEELSK